MVSKYKEHLQLLCAVDELCDPAFFGADEMGEVVADFDTMSDWNLAMTLSGYCFGEPEFMFE